MIDIETLASAKAKELGEDTGEWTKELLTGSSEGILSRLTDGELQRVVKSLKSIDQLQRLQNSMKVDPSAMDRLLTVCDASPYSLAEWFESYDFFLKWLETQNSSSTPAVMLGYLNCCVEYSKGKPHLETLKSLLEDMLNVHGFNGKVPLRLSHEN